VQGTSTALHLIGTSSGAGERDRDDLPRLQPPRAGRLVERRTQLYYSSLVGTNDQYSANLVRVPAQLAATRVPLTANGPQDGYDYLPATGGGQAPPADSVAPAVGVSVTSTGTTSMTLSFTGSAKDVSRYVLRYAAGPVAPATSGLGHAGLHRAAQDGIALTGLTPGMQYSFSAHAVDWAGNVGPLATRHCDHDAHHPPDGRRCCADRSLRHPLGTDDHADRRRRRDAARRPRVQLLARRTTTPTAAWAVVGTATTDATGAATASHLPTVHTDYKWQYAGDAATAPASSPIALVSVRNVLTAALDRTTMLLGATAELRGSVRPAQPGEKVALQRKIDGVWTSLTSGAISSTSAYFFPLKPPAKGERIYRVVKWKDAGNLTGVSPVVTLVVT
jgi:hypothetical protein